MSRRAGDKRYSETIRAGMDHITAPRLQGILSIWRSCRGPGEICARKSHLDPIALGRADVLPYAWILERTDGGFRYRLLGEEIRRNFPNSIKGKCLFEVYNDETARHIYERSDRLLTDPAMEYSEGDVVGSGGRMYTAQRLVLPLTDEDGRYNYLIGCVNRIDEIPYYETFDVPIFETTTYYVTPIANIVG